jgi:hypothetical protein
VEGWEQEAGEAVAAADQARGQGDHQIEYRLRGRALEAYSRALTWRGVLSQIPTYLPRRRTQQHGSYRRLGRDRVRALLPAAVAQAIRRSELSQQVTEH